MAWAANAPEKLCPLCGEQYASLYKIHFAFDREQIAAIKRTHPDWVDGNGACFLCINYCRQDYGLPALTEDECHTLGLL